MRNNRTRKQMGIVRVVRVYVGRSNHAKLDVLDVARRQLDHLGPLGMRAKRVEQEGLFRRGRCGGDEEQGEAGGEAQRKTP